jgi:hypothetical protein
MTSTKPPFAWFSFGRAYRWHMDRQIAFGIWPRKNPQLGEISHRISFELAWSWPRWSSNFIKD